MHPEGRPAAFARRGLTLLCLAVVFVLLPVPAAAQSGAPDSPFQSETRYVVPAADLTQATAFLVYLQDADDERGLAGRTIGLRAPVGAESLAVRNDTGAPLEWVPRGDGGIDVGLSAGTRAVQVIGHQIPVDRGAPEVRFAGPVATLRVNLLVALPPGVETTAQMLPAGPRTLDSMPESWPVPADAEIVAASWAADDAPERVRFVAAAAAGPAKLPLPLTIALGVFLVAATLWALRRVHRGISAPTAVRTMPILEHLNELRRRTLWVLGTLVVGAAFFFTFGFRHIHVLGRAIPVPFPTIYDNAAAQIFFWLSSRVVAPGIQIIVTNPFDAVLTQMGLAVGLAVLVTFPVLFYHVYAFLAPGLRPEERRAVLLSVPFVVVLFLVGGAFGLLVMMPFTVRVLYSFAGTLAATAFLNVHDLVGLAAVMAIVFGLAFQLPLVMALTARIGLVRAATYRAKWRHAALSIVIVSALVTDPTIITQLMVAAVMSGLYIVGLVLAYVVERRQATGEDEAAVGDTV